jgi:hypothetical protein
VELINQQSLILALSSSKDTHGRCGDFLHRRPAASVMVNTFDGVDIDAVS